MSLGDMDTQTRSWSDLSFHSNLGYGHNVNVGGADQGRGRGRGRSLITPHYESSRAPELELPMPSMASSVCEFFTIFTDSESEEPSPRVPMTPPSPPSTSEPAHMPQQASQVPMQSGVSLNPVQAPLLAPMQIAEPQQILVSDWQQVLDPATGSTYYWNRSTGETSWKPLVESVESAPAADSPPALTAGGSLPARHIPHSKPASQWLHPRHLLK